MTSNETPTTPSHTPEDDLELDASVDAAFGGELLSGWDPVLMMESLNRTITPAAYALAMANVAAQTPAIIAGDEDVPIPEDDPRFQDPAFREGPGFRFWAQSYLVWEREMMALVDRSDVDWRTRERSRLFMSALTSAAAPTNTLLGNPEALKRAITTSGQSLFTGASNFARDIVDNGGLPSQVDPSAFVVGENIAATPGWVVHRTEMFELIHYAPTGERVAAIPLLLLPPPVNKFYFWDLSPGRSLIEYAVGRGLDVFTISWRDPQEDHASWGMDAYLASTLEALEAVRRLTEAPQAHVFGDCSGGMFLCMLLAYEAATGRHTIRSGTLGVTVVDFGEPGGIGITASDQGLHLLKRKAERGEIITASSINSAFVWMRPNDLVWRYVVDDWLLGKPPPAFDIMFWNGDGQGLTAQLAAEMTQMSLDNALIRPGAMTALGEPVDLSAVQVDVYHIAGLTDHISPWKGCYAAAKTLGGHNTFVLTPTGHVQSIIYPMGKKRAAFYTNPTIRPDPEAWFREATKHEDSWWEHWVDWLLERSDGTRALPAAFDDEHRELHTPAPGTYIFGE